MATFTAYVGALRPYWPEHPDDDTWAYPVAADIIVLNEDGEGLGANGRTSPSSRLNTIVSTPEGVVIGDDIDTLRDKLTPSIRPLFPQIEETDDVTVVWLDGATVTTLAARPAAG